MKSCWERKNGHISLMKLNNSVEHNKECRDFLQAVSSIFKKAIQNLNDGESQPKRFIVDSKKSPVRHSIRRGNTLEPTEEELAKTNNKRALLGWYKKCNELKVYWKKNGHCDVPRKDPKLGVWVKNQRGHKKRHEAGLKTAMNNEKLQHLSDMDFQWSVIAEWDQRYEELKHFKEEHGHCRIPCKGKLGIWGMHQRSTANRPKSSEKIAKLEAIGFFDS